MHCFSSIIDAMDMCSDEYILFLELCTQVNKTSGASASASNLKYQLRYREG